MIKINNSIIHLNFETQFDKNRRPFRLSGTIKKNEYNTIHRFRYLDELNDFFDIEVNYKGEFLNFKKNNKI